MSEEFYTVIGTYSDPVGQRFAMTVRAETPFEAEKKAYAEAIKAAGIGVELIVAAVIKGSPELADVKYTDGVVGAPEPEPELEGSAGLLQKLQRAGIKRVTANWYGSGDEGTIQDVELFDDHGRNVGEAGPGFRDGSEKNLAEEFEEWLGVLLYDQVGSWGDNEGGAGSLDFNVESGVVQVDHGMYAEPVLYPTPFKIDMQTGAVMEVPTWPNQSINELEPKAYDRNLSIGVRLGELADEILKIDKALSTDDPADYGWDMLGVLREKLAEWFDDKNRRTMM